MENKDLKETLISELETMYRMIGLMQPKSEAEFIAVALPNLHLALFEWLKSKQEEIEEELNKMKKEIDSTKTVKRGTATNANRRKINYNQALDDLKPIISNLLKL